MQRNMGDMFKLRLLIDEEEGTVRVYVEDKNTGESEFVYTMPYVKVSDELGLETTWDTFAKDFGENLLDAVEELLARVC